MSKAVEHIYKIHNNPFVLTPLLVGFFLKYHGQENDVLLSYLVLPLVLHEDTKNWLLNANVRSSLLTFARNKENFFGLPERIVEYKSMTNLCLQHAKDNSYISIENNLSIKVNNPELTCILPLKDSLKASENFIKIIKDLNIVTIYRLLGVKSL